VIGILSIDFDYFINASSQARDMYFPKGSDEIPENKLKSRFSFLKKISEGIEDTQRKFHESRQS